MEYKDLEKLLIENYSGKRIEEKLIRTIAKEQDYYQYCKMIQKLVDFSVIKPVKNSGPNGLNPPLYKRYQVKKHLKNYDKYIPEIRLLHHVFNIEGYLMQPAKYVEHKKWIAQLDYFMKNNNEILKTEVSINERSFQIFHIEKALKENKDVRKILNFNPLLEEYLNYYFTPEPFFEFNIIGERIGGLKKINILIIENKDTWYTLRKNLTEKTNNIHGIPFHVLLYGEGKKIARKKDSLTEYTVATFKNKKVEYYYFGDIDYEGIGIFENLIQTNPDLNIKPMKNLYIDMLNLASNAVLPRMKDNQKQKIGSNFYSYFTKEEAEKIESILKEGAYIPQEILNYQEFNKIISEKRERYDGVFR